MITEQKKIIKPWGYEIVWTRSESIKGKILGINRGQSFHLHEGIERILNAPYDDVGLVVVSD